MKARNNNRQTPSGLGGPRSGHTRIAVGETRGVGNDQGSTPKGSDMLLAMNRGFHPRLFRLRPFGANPARGTTWCFDPAAFDNGVLIP